MEESGRQDAGPTQRPRAGRSRETRYCEPTGLHSSGSGEHGSGMRTAPLAVFRLSLATNTLQGAVRVAHRTLQGFRAYAIVIVQ